MFPGIKAHLSCLKETFPVQIVGALHGESLEYASKRYEWFARYLEGRLNICD